MAAQFVEIEGQRVSTGVDKADWRKLSTAQKQRIVNELDVPANDVSSRQESEKRPQIDSVVEGLRSAIGQGTLLGFGDELEAAARTGSFSSPEYKDLRDQLRAQQDEYRRQNPVISIVGELAGGFLLPGGAAVNLVRQGAKSGARVLAKEAAGRARNIGKAAGLGAISGGVTGAAAGAGTADELEDVGEGAVVGGVLGTALGAAAPAAMSSLGQAARGVARRLGVGSANFSDRKVRQYLAREGFTPQQAAAEVRRMRESGVRGATLADLGQQTQDLAFGAQAVANPAQTRVTRQLTDRFRQQAEEIQDEMAGRLGTTPDEAGNFLDDIATQQQAQARLNYPTAYEMELDAEPFKKYLNNPNFSEIYENARKLSTLQMMARGSNQPPLPTFDEFKQLADAGTLPTEFLHQVKRGFDVLIEKDTDDLTGKMQPAAAALSAIKKQFNDEIKDQNDAYRIANQNFADLETVKRANKVGQDIDKTPARVLKSKVDDMNEGEKAAFVRGLVDRFNTLVETTGANQDFVRQIFNKGRRRDAIRAAFPASDEGAKAFAEFEKFMEDQARLVTTNRRVIGGSPTASRQQVLAETGAEPGDGVIDLLSNPTPQNILNRFIRSAGGMSEKAAEQTLDTLFSTNPIDLAAATARLQRQQERMARPQGLGLLSTGTLDPIAVGGGTGAISGNLYGRNERRKRNRQGLLR